MKKGDAARADREGGFTLIELLVSMTLLSLLSLCLYTAISFAAKAFDRAHSHARAIVETDGAQETLRGALAKAFPLFLSKENPPRVAFEGGSQRIEFLTALPALQPGNARVSLSTQANGRLLDVIMSAESELGVGRRLPTQRVLGHVRAIRFSYFGRSANQEKPQWHPQWRNESELPDLVRVDVSFEAGDVRHWPSLIIRPEIGADAVCVYDPFTKYCRGR